MIMQWFAKLYILLMTLKFFVLADVYNGTGTVKVGVSNTSTGTSARGTTEAEMSTSFLQSADDYAGGLPFTTEPFVKATAHDLSAEEKQGKNTHENGPSFVSSFYLAPTENISTPTSSDHYTSTRISTKYGNTDENEKLQLKGIITESIHVYTDKLENVTLPTSRVSSSISFSHDVCNKYGSCDLVPGKIWYCYCDELCEEYNDCCQNYIFTNKNRSGNAYTCLSIENSQMNLLGVQAISNCPDDYNDTVTADRCADNRMEVTGPPVLNIRNQSQVYKNIYCATCNDVSQVQMDVLFTPFKDSYPTLDLPDEVFHTYWFNHSNYRILIPQNASVRYCIAGLIQNEELMCKRYVNPIRDDRTDVFYRNYHCIDKNDDVDGECLQDFDKSWLTDPRTHNLLKLSVLFSFGLTGTEETNDDCKEWNEENDRLCQHLPRYINVPVALDYGVKLSDDTATNDMIRIAVLTLWVKSVEGFTNVSHKFQLKVNENSTFINILSECIVIKKVFSHELTVISERLRDQKVLIKEINNSDRQFETTNLTYSSYMKPVRFMSPMFSTMNSRYKYFGLEIPEKPLTSFCDDIEIFVERKRINFLKVVSLNCKVSVRALEGQKPSVLSFLTYVLTTISTVSLIIMVIIIRCRHVNNEISFASLESLGFSMIVSNILFLTGHFISDLSSLACYVISVISHFLWLTVFSFASLRVYLIVKALNKMKAMRFKTRENQTRKRRMMTAVGVVLPLLVVGPAIVVDKLGPKYYSPGYGTGDVCFPIKFPGNLIFFSGPVFLSIILNCTIIVQIIIRIHMASVASGNMRQSSLFSEAQIYLRILSISGCFWVTGILAAYFQSEWLEYIFTIVCGLQGAFVALANLTTRRMRCCKTKERQNIQDVITI